ncbi:biosynthetic arginine decarboxylase [Rubinisphaera italica]|uniref:biosynthetic arginine decarboxylase n=1 Tax=Rubinisphaera italica TaxID=2527969 RepID=UPI0011B60E2B|nr:biosynthetic arginine decarboxylase [Rubinisphaera italica]
MVSTIQETWTAADSAELYDIESWGKGYFTVNDEGRIQIRPNKGEAAVDLLELTDQLKSQGISTPILFRFSGILQQRLKEIYQSFDAAIKEYDYNATYTCVYPVKVNPQRQVVEEVVRYGRVHGAGLEAGSKPELLAVLAVVDRDTPVICNGFKDAKFIQTALLARKMGMNVTPVVERLTELNLIISQAKELGVRPKIGVRVKLASRGAGKWQESAGYQSKFGLTVSELMKAFEDLEAAGMQDCLSLMHFHFGSQITNISRVKTALIEASRIYVDLAKRGSGLEYLDVGGGLGVDYDGSQSTFESSVNYTLEEYARDVVYHVKTVCDEAGVAHPHIISESGRALTAYHSVLVFDVLGTTGPETYSGPDELLKDAKPPLAEMMEIRASLNAHNLRESFHDALQLLETALSLFSMGHLPLDQRAAAEKLYWNICGEIRNLSADLEFIPEELEGLSRLLADTYFCNFSVFQSLPDSWAIKQLFPVIPIHRLSEKPERHAVLGDITCDSDGKIDHFIGQRDVKRTLQLHHFNGSQYLLGAFLIGAYQEILGDLHNLFGDTNTVHVTVDHQGKPVIQTTVVGETISEVLDYVQFDGQNLLGRMTASAESALREGRLTQQEADDFIRNFQQGLGGYTYLE